MVEVAEQEGKLIPGQSVVIEPTSGNTGIGLAMTCAIKVGNTCQSTITDKGYSVIITMPKKMSLEKEAALRALGAEVIRTPNEAAWDSPESHMGVALRLQKEIPGGIILNQYRNMNNPLVHELTTAPEIIEAVTSTLPSQVHPSSGKVDAFVAGAGTGGTVSGVARGIKKAHNADCVVVGVDPVGSVLALPATLNEVGKGSPYVVEGIGYDFTPDVLTREPHMIDTWVKTNDTDSFAAVQLLMRHEAMLVGGSSGSALAGGLAWLRSDNGKEISQTPGKNVVIMLPDGLRNYINKDWFLDIAFRQEPSPLAKRIAEVLDLSAGENE
ncbi:pyridoxal phosphate-dependent enzyme beta subunit [Russula vinacea]|nr:pyridoxal phosphate-dependent enzyme beta subunit [Russula vinacea]